MVKSHLASGVRGVGPAERTGKSRVSYWPGGSRRPTESAGRRPRNAREISDTCRNRKASQARRLSDGVTDSSSRAPSRNSVTFIGRPI